MNELLLFSIEKYIPILLFVLAFYGYGKIWSKTLKTPSIEDTFLRICLQIAAGMGAFILLMQFIGVVGLLKKDLIRALLALGIACIFVRHSTGSKLSGPTATGALRTTCSPWYGAAAVLILLAMLASTTYKPLTPPTHWDELMYHLPHVREWLSAKKISINEWLRYPYFPYNFNLLYAAFISIIGEYDTSLMHAVAGWLTTLMLFRLTQNNYGPFMAVLAVAIWIPTSRSFYETAYIDLGLTLFIFSAVVFFNIWIQDDEKNSSLLAASAFFLGLAAGTKYQAAIYPPFFILAAFFYERRPMVWIKVALAFSIPCIFWYTRNAILTGNPVDPLAGSIFGYYDWDAGDFAWQMEDLGLWKNFPPPAIWLALLPLILPAAWKDTSTRWLLLLSVYATGIWYVTSHYDRYLVPQYPILALLASIGIFHVTQKLHSILKINRIYSSAKLWPIDKLTFTVAAISFVGIALPSAYKGFKKTPISREARHAYINDRAQNFSFLQSLQTYYSDRKIYQLGLEGGIFYGPRKMYGDHFGPWRYRDYISSSPRDIHDKLNKNGFEILAVDPAATKRLEALPDFHKYFSEVLEKNGAKAYLVLK